MQIELDEATAKLIDNELARGAFSSRDEVVAAAVRLFHSGPMEDWLDEHRDDVRAAVAEAAASKARGEGFSPQESRAMLERSRAERKAKAA